MVQVELETPCDQGEIVPKAKFIERGRPITGVNPNLEDMDVDILYHLGQVTQKLEILSTIDRFLVTKNLSSKFVSKNTLGHFGPRIHKTEIW